MDDKEKMILKHKPEDQVRVRENPGKCIYWDCADKVVCSADSPVHDFKDKWTCYTPVEG